MLAVIRAPLLLIHFLVINVLLLLLCAIRPFHRDNVYLCSRLYKTMSWYMGMKLIVNTPSNFDKTRPYVFIGNHQNSYDLMTICAAAQPGMVTVGKKSLKWIPIFGQLYWLSGNIMIDRKNSGRAHDTLKTTAKKIRERRLGVWFFPEGTRSYGRGLLPFKSGAFRIAKETKEPIVMVCASSTHNKVNWNRWNNGTVIIDLSEPVEMDDSKDTREWSDHFHGLMEKRIAELDAQVAEMDK